MNAICENIVSSKHCSPPQSKTMTYSSVAQKVNWASTESYGRWAVCATLSQCSTNTDSMILYILHWMIIVIFFSLKILSQQIIFSLFVYYKMPKYKYVDNNRNNVIRYILPPILKYHNLWHLFLFRSEAHFWTCLVFTRSFTQLRIWPRLIAVDLLGPNSETEARKKNCHNPFFFKFCHKCYLLISNNRCELYCILSRYFCVCPSFCLHICLSGCLLSQLSTSLHL